MNTDPETHEFTSVEATDAVNLNISEIAAAHELASLRRTLRAMKERETALRDQLASALGEDATVGLDAEGHALVKVTRSIRRGTNRKLLEADFPEAFAATGTVTEQTQVRIDVPVALRDVA